MMNSEQYREHIERTLTFFARLSFTTRRWVLTRKYGKSSSLKYHSTIFESLILSLLRQQMSIS